MERKFSWKTTVGGILAAIGAWMTACAFCPEWFDVLGGTLQGVGMLIVGGTARDVNVSSESAGAK